MLRVFSTEKGGSKSRDISRRHPYISPEERETLWFNQVTTMFQGPTNRMGFQVARILQASWGRSVSNSRKKIHQTWGLLFLQRTHLYGLLPVLLGHLGQRPPRRLQLHHSLKREIRDARMGKKVNQMEEIWHVRRDMKSCDLFRFCGTNRGSSAIDDSRSYTTILASWPSMCSGP